jgi:hypothetical protein
MESNWTGAIERIMKAAIVQCFYHPVNRAMVECSACRRPLCPSCDHRIKGFPYCQDCIVRGIEMLRRPQNAYSSEPHGRAHSPKLAALFALIPGLGAVYNRQRVKALAHFIMVVGLFELADLTNLGFFGIGGSVFYFFSIMDAYRTAKAMRGGLDPAKQDERLREMLMARMHVLALVLIALGGLFLASDVLQMFNLSLSLRRLWPLMLIGVGGYLVVKYYRAGRARGEPAAEFYPTPPSLFAPTGRLSGRLHEGKSGGAPPPSDRPR